MERGCASTGRSFSGNASAAVVIEHFIFAAIVTGATGTAVVGAVRKYDDSSAGKPIANTNRVLRANSTIATVNVPTVIVRLRSA